MKVFLGTDHAGFELKETVKEFLMKEGYEVEDCGAYEYDKNDDYPDFCAAAAKNVVKNPGSFGFVFGKSGAGECIVANKIQGIRAFLAINKENVRLAREHNDANVMSLGSEIVTDNQANQLAHLFVSTPFSQDERHKRRIEKITTIEHEQHT